MIRAVNHPGDGSICRFVRRGKTDLIETNGNQICTKKESIRNGQPDASKNTRKLSHFIRMKKFEHLAVKTNVQHFFPNS